MDLKKETHTPAELAQNILWGMLWTNFFFFFFKNGANAWWMFQPDMLGSLVIGSFFIASTSLKNSINKNCLLDSIKKNSHLCCLSQITGISCVWMLSEYRAKKIYPRKMAYCTSLPSFPFKLHRGLLSWQLEFSFSQLLVSVLNFWMEPWLSV